MSYQTAPIPRIPCPYCGKKYHRADQAISCAGLDIKEEEKRNRKLRKLNYEKQNHEI